MDPARAAAMFGRFYDLSYNKYYVDEFYDRTLFRGLEVVRNFLARFDLRIIDGIVNGTASGTVKTSRGSGRFDLSVVDRLVNWLAEVIQGYGQRIRRIESGVIQNYVLKAGGAFGVMVVLWFVMKSLWGGA